MAIRTEFKVTETLMAETCCNCGVYFGLAEATYDARKRDGGDFYCPNGHAQHYTDSLVAQLKKANDALASQKAWTDQAEESARWWREYSSKVEKKLSTTKGVVTRMKNRVSKGVCPCCNRHFTNLERHMHSQHPEFATDAK